MRALVPLRGGRPAWFRPYDWDTNALADETATIGPERLIIVEGLFVSRPELSQLVDVMVLVCADSDVRWRRQLARRDAGRQWLERWDAAERWYFKYARHPESFDFAATDAGCP
jgi:uridine kinase